MKNRKKALLLASIASLCILCGCKENEVIEIDGEQYIKSGEDYTRLDLSPREFEPGTHVIRYSDDSDSHLGEPGWGNSIINIPEVPEGYKYVETISIISEGYGSHIGYVHIFVNTKTVLARGVYNPETNRIEYSEPGEVVEERALEMGD